MPEENPPFVLFSSGPCQVLGLQRIRAPSPSLNPLTSAPPVGGGVGGEQRHLSGQTWICAHPWEK